MEFFDELHYTLYAIRNTQYAIPYTTYQPVGWATCLPMLSILFDWNLSTLLIKLFWIIMSIYGLVRVLRDRKRN